MLSYLKERVAGRTERGSARGRPPRPQELRDQDLRQVPVRRGLSRVEQGDAVRRGEVSDDGGLHDGAPGPHAGPLQMRR